MIERALRLLTVAAYVLLSTVSAWPQAALLPNAQQQFFDQNGNPLSNGKVYMFVPNTAVPKTTWSDSGETTANQNPVPLDAGGFAVIYGQGTYNQKVTDANGNQIWNKPTTAWNSAAPSGATGTDTAPVGTVVPWASFTVPINWALANGQTLNRTTYSDLLTALTISNTTVSCTNLSPNLGGWSDTSQMRVGAPVEASCIPVNTTITAIVNSSTITVSNNATATIVTTGTVFPWGNGDGATTFNVPDLRGRGFVGADSMGGTAAGVLSASTTITTLSGVANATVGSLTGLYAGMTITSTNVPAGTTILSVNPNITSTLVTTTGSATATVTSATGLAAGMTISSPNVTPGTTISSISGTTITMSALALTPTVTADVLNTQATVFLTSSSLGLKNGMGVTGTGIPGGTTISAISGGVLTLSGNATSSTQGTTLSFTGATAAVPATFSGNSIVMSNNASGSGSATAATFTAFSGAASPAASGGSPSHTLALSEAPRGLSSLVDSGHSHEETFRGGAGSNSGVSGSGSQGPTSTTAPHGTNTSSANLTLTDNAGGATHATLGPVLTTNFIIKVKANSTGAGGVVSLGGMFGDIVCDGSFNCSAQSGINTIGLQSFPSGTLYANISGVTKQLTPTTNSAFMDSVIGSARGSFPYRGASTWGALALGANNTWLSSNGTDAVWATLPVASAAQLGLVQGDGASLTISGPGVISCTQMTTLQKGCAKTDGVTTSLNGSGQIVAVGAASASIAVGVTTISGGVNGSIFFDNAGVLGNATLSSLTDTAFGSAQGDILYRSAAGWTALAPGTSGQFLQTQGAAANPQWASSLATVAAGTEISVSTVGSTATVSAPRVPLSTWSLAGGI